MKPVAIFRHTRTEGPGYFATFLDKHSIPWRLIAIDRGDDMPASTEPFSGICLMGGSVSVNDPLPWIEQSCHLIREAISKNIPVIGHCLGGQLMSKALGGQVTTNPVKEIGWSPVWAEDNAETRKWLGNTLTGNRGAIVFQWHGETFSIPSGATRILTNSFCDNQMFVLGRHLGMQCHVEMTPEMIDCWNRQWHQETRGLVHIPPCIQTPEEMRRETTENLPEMRHLAEQLYSVWIDGLTRGE